MVYPVWGLPGNSSGEQFSIVKKGEVRAAILYMLSQQPRTVSELARLLRVSKPTITYHVKYLRAKNLVDVVKHEADRRGFEKKLLMLKEAARLVPPNPDLEERYLRMLKGVMSEARGKLLKESPEPLGRRLQSTLLHVFRLLPYVARTRHNELLERFGEEVGREVVGRRLAALNLKDALRSLKTFWENNSLGVMNFQQPNRGSILLRFHNCFECNVAPDFNGPLCHFVQGLIGGIWKSRFNASYSVSEIKFQEPGSPYCEVRIKPTK